MGAVSSVVQPCRSKDKGTVGLVTGTCRKVIQGSSICLAEHCGKHDRTLWHPWQRLHYDGSGLWREGGGGRERAVFPSQTKNQRTVFNNRRRILLTMPLRPVRRVIISKPELTYGGVDEERPQQMKPANDKEPSHLPSHPLPTHPLPLDRRTGGWRPVPCVLFQTISCCDKVGGLKSL